MSKQVEHLAGGLGAAQRDRRQVGRQEGVEVVDAPHQVGLRLHPGLRVVGRTKFSMVGTPDIARSNNREVRGLEPDLRSKIEPGYPCVSRQIQRKRENVRRSKLGEDNQQKGN